MPQASSKSCHSERRKIIRKADDLAESRNLLSADTTTNRGGPSFAHCAKSGTPQPHLSEDLASATIGKATTSAVPQALSKSCHSERRKIIRKADDLAESRNLLSVGTITNRGAPFFAHFAKSGIPQPHPSEDLASATPGKGTTSVVPQASKEMQPVILGQAQFPRQASREIEKPSRG